MLEELNGISAQIYSVSDLNGYIRALLESNENLMDIWVSGEVSNLSQPRSGHIYFTLKDERAQLRCVVWRMNAIRLAGALRDGMLVEAHGAVGVYEGSGQYQLYVDGVRSAGEGQLFQEFLRLKNTLEAEGLFAEERKRPIPTMPNLIGIVTSATSAALQDMLRTLRGRYPLADVVLSPTSVQGEAAPQEIVRALDLLNTNTKPDLIIIGRGGGSLEDLWAFNDERVVRAVAASAAPVISGVGHETDFTLTDFAADLRTPTPTGAAVAAAPDITELAAELFGKDMLMDQMLHTYIDKLQAETNEQGFRLEKESPSGQIRQRMQMLDNASLHLSYLAENYFLSCQKQLAVNAEKLTSYDPTAVLNRGYAIIKDTQGTLVKSIKQVKLGVGIHAHVSDGVISADVTNVQKKKVAEDGKKNRSN